jgi:poly-gamma-glutamate synthesis protein (capsule biosynthesis protein)
MLSHRRRFLKLSAAAIGWAMSRATEVAPSSAVAAEGTSSGAARPVRLFLCGDVMTGRGVDQILPHPVDPRLFEPAARSASEYVALAETANGPIRRPVAFAYVWGDALAELDRRRLDFRVINLETAVTRSEDAAPKGINYRMSPENFASITAAGIDCCGLANNHVLDWGPRGLIETLDTLRKAGVSAAGAGRSTREAALPAILARRDGTRVLVFAFGSETSGIPRGWAATETRPGVNLLPDMSLRTVRAIAQEIHAVKRPRDIVVASIHWGSNWGYDVPRSQRTFAHALIDEAGVDVVHGHSSHHPKAIEVYRRHLILHGCGDFLNDYEGIGGHEEFRSDLVIAYFPELSAVSGDLLRLDMAPFRIRNFRLIRASRVDVEWLAQTLSRVSDRFGARVEANGGATMALRWR